MELRDPAGLGGLQGRGEEEGLVPQDHLVRGAARRHFLGQTRGGSPLPLFLILRIRPLQQQRRAPPPLPPPPLAAAAPDNTRRRLDMMHLATGAGAGATLRAPLAPPEDENAAVHASSTAKSRARRRSPRRVLSPWT